MKTGKSGLEVWWNVTLAINLNNVNMVLDPYSSGLLSVASSTWGKEKARHCNFNLKTQFDYSHNMTLRSPMWLNHYWQCETAHVHSSASIPLKHESPELKSSSQPHSMRVYILYSHMIKVKNGLPYMSTTTSVTVSAIRQDSAVSKYLAMSWLIRVIFLGRGHPCSCTMCRLIFGLG
jgi:hypothetical protein